jgi:DNA gyrase subunit B
MPDLVERGHIYIAQPPLYKVKHGKQERYLKDEHELKQYLLTLALNGAELRTSLEAPPLMGDALDAVAKEFLLAEAVIDRVCRLVDYQALYALLKNPVMDLSDGPMAAISAQALQALLPKPDFEVLADYDEAQESHRLVIRRHFHGNVQTSYIDREFLQSGDYEQLKKTASVLEGLFGEGASIKRGEHARAVSDFKQALDWLLEEVKDGLNLQRYKGLGEMNPEQLWETTMDPNVRRLLKVQVEDAITADEIFTTLMGDQVEPRRAFIESNALIARNIDV